MASSVLTAQPTPVLPSLVLQQAKELSHDAGVQAGTTVTRESTVFRRLNDFTSNVLVLGGHRGLGANYWDRAAGEASPALHFPVRENTIPSFLKSIAAGASFVEFDVQVTGDGVPVIWHDNYVITGTRAAPVNRRISDLTYAEFVALVPGSADLPYQKAGQVAGLRPADAAQAAGPGIVAAGAFSGIETSTTSAPARLLRKVDGDLPADAGTPTLAGWECDSEERLPSLAELFAALPAGVAFDIEVKVALPCTVAHTPLAELERLLGPILREVGEAEAAAAAAGTPRRELLFSSFDPDVCAELAQRRPQDTVMFLSGGGQYPHVDPRRTSFRAAVDWAAATNLHGVIFHAGRLRGELELVRDALAGGLQVMTYGVDNADPAYVQQQYDAGVHGIIVDDVSSVIAALSRAGGVPDRREAANVLSGPAQQALAVVAARAG